MTRAEVKNTYKRPKLQIKVKEKQNSNESRKGTEVNKRKYQRAI